MSKVKEEKKKKIISARIGKNFCKALGKCQAHVFWCRFNGRKWVRC